MNELFEFILDKDETIIKTIKPNKKRFVYLRVLFSSIFLCLFTGVFITMAVLFGTHFFDSNVDMGMAGIVSCISFSIFALLIFFFAFFPFLVAAVSYKKTVYAYTNKRLIIRTGFVGVDFKTLDMAMIGSVNVNVSILDKMCKPNTGTIVFGSMASPLINSANVQRFSFIAIDNPYDLYKEIKEVIDERKNK